MRKNILTSLTLLSIIVATKIAAAGTIPEAEHKLVASSPILLSQVLAPKSSDGGSVNLKNGSVVTHSLITFELP